MAFDKAVYVKLIGGLGNQMFQYAAGLAQARRLGVPLKLDLSWFPSSGNRHFMLDHFMQDASIATADELAQFAAPNAERARRVLRRLIKRNPDLTRHPLLRHRHVFIERNGPWSLVHDPDILRCTAPLHLNGFFQSEKYFAENADEIRTAFTLRDALSPASQRTAELMAAETWPVSLHVRRGDYVSNAHVNALHGVCPMAYYEHAVRLIDQISQGNAHYFIFSDDPAWVRDSFGHVENRTIVAGNDDRPWEDMALMAQCRDHIVANSSFSWWGAWLDPRPGKTVVAPRYWLARAQLANVPPVDVVPEDWILLWS